MKVWKRRLALFLAILTLFSVSTPTASAESVLNTKNLFLQIKNEYASFGYGAHNENPFEYEDYKTVYGDNAAARAYYDAAEDRGWYGSCYGIAAVALLLYMSRNQDGKFPGVKEFSGMSQFARVYADMLKVEQTVNATINGVTQTVTLQKLIELMHISQKDMSIQRSYDSSLNHYDDLIRALTPVHEEGRDPVLIGIGFDKGKGEEGHALIGYDYKDFSDRTEVNVYDCNYPEDTNRVLTLEKDTYGKYSGWRYQTYPYEEWGTEAAKDSTDMSSSLKFVTYSQVYASWSNISSKDRTINPPEDLILLTVGYEPQKDDNGVPDKSGVRNENLNFSIQTYWGEDYIQIKNGKVTRLRDSESSSYYQVTELEVTYDSSNDYLPVWGRSNWVPASAYRIINNGDKNGEVKEWMITAVHKDQSISVKTTANEVCLYLNDADPASCVEIVEPNEKYSITLHSSLKSSKSGAIDDMPYPDRTTPASVSRESPLTILWSKDQRYTDHVESDKVNGAHAELLSIITSDKVLPDDVPETSAYYPGVFWAMDQGIAVGYGNGSVRNGKKYVPFQPHKPCTRMHILTFIWRYAGRKAVEIQQWPFEDVSDTEMNEDFRKAAVWAYQEELISGSRLEKDTPCTRADAMYYLWKLDGGHTQDNVDEVLSEFPDLQTAGQNGTLNDDYLNAIAWGYRNNITNGTTPTTFSPNMTCTRAQIATFLHRMDEAR